MRPDEEGMGSVVHRVRDNTLQYMQELLSENARLRVLNATLENENQHLQGQLTSLKTDLSRTHEEQAKLRRQLTDIEVENRRYSEQYVEVEQQNAKLANLYVASHRLHATLDRNEVLTTIQDIVANLIGSEEVGIFELDASGKQLTLVASSGIDKDVFRTVPLGTGLIGRVALTGAIHLADQQGRDGARPEEANLTACIPLTLGHRVTGAIAVFRLLRQKAALEELDCELFELLATHAAMAFYCTKLHEQGAKP